MYFDLIARIVPGSLLLLFAAMVQLGPRGWFDLAISKVPAANLMSVLLFGIAAYFVSIVLSQIWYILSAPSRRRGYGNADSPALDFEIHKHMLSESLRLGKLQAEKNLCEVMIPGLAMLATANVWMMATRPDGIAERGFLLVGMVLAIGACWGWRRSLEGVYRESRRALKSLLPTRPETGEM